MYADVGRNDGTLLRELTEDDANEFNRFQRVHQNNSEILATFFVMMAIAGVAFPVYATIGGLIWVIGRGVYALGYYSATENRVYGVFFPCGRNHASGVVHHIRRLLVNEKRRLLDSDMF